MLFPQLHSYSQDLQDFQMHPGLCWLQVTHSPPCSSCCPFLLLLCLRTDSSSQTLFLVLWTLFFIVHTLAQTCIFSDIILEIVTFSTGQHSTDTIQTGVDSQQPRLVSKGNTKWWQTDIKTDIQSVLSPLIVIGPFLQWHDPRYIINICISSSPSVSSF